jgi:hypothetical protein
MSTAKASINLPKTIGGNNLVDSFNKISLSSELKDFLAALGGRLTVSFSAGSDRPEFEILDKTGKSVCSIDEFVKLGGFRRWVNDELKALEKEQASDEKVELMALFYREAKKNTTLSERIEESNETKFRQFHSMVMIIDQNMEAINDAIASDIRSYLVEKGRRLIIILYGLMLECLAPKKLDKERLDKELIQNMIPKWLFNKFVDKQFTNNLKADAESLLFPKGNYLKSIALTTKELKDEKFLAGNREIVKKSGAIIELAKQDWTILFPHLPKELEDDVGEFITNMMWTLNSPYKVEKILELRMAGKTPPTFKMRQKPNPKPGSKARPETEAQRVCREVFNAISALNATFLHFQNLVIPVVNPLEEFWSQICTDTDDWEISPTHGLYEHVKESGKDLSPIKDLSNDPLLSLIGEILCQTVKASTNSAAGKMILTAVKGLKNKSNYVPAKDAGYVIDSKKDIDVAVLKKTELDKEIIEDTKKFLGAVSKKKNRKLRRGQSAVRLHTSVLNELGLLKDSPIYERAKEWISNSFKTADRHKTQLIAAQFLVGEALKYQEELLAEDFDEFRALGEIEDYDEEE